MPSLPPRHVGSVVDPEVRDDGGIEPELWLAPGPGAPPAEIPPLAEAPASRSSGGGSPRDRLLARAGLGAATPEDDEPWLPGEPLAPGDRELEVMGGEPLPPSAPRVGRAPALPPVWRAVVGALAGVAVVWLLVAVAMRLEQRRAELPAPGAIAARAAAPGPTAAPPDMAAAPVARVRQKLPGPWRIGDEPTRGRVIKAKIGSLPFLKAITDAGVGTKQAYRIHTALSKVHSVDRCNRTDEVIALVDASKVVRAFEFVVSKEEVFQAREGADGLLAATKLDFKVERATTVGSFVYDGQSFAASARAGGFEPALEAALRKAMAAFFALDALQRGDTLRVIAQEVTVLGEFSRYAGIEAVEIRPAAAGEKPLRVYYFNGQNERGHFDAQARSTFEGGWRKPVREAPITSRYNPKRMHPVLKKVMPHNGTDFGAPAGTPVGAASFGKVTQLGPSGPCGNMVTIDHGNGVETGYCHLSRFAEGLKQGDRVKRLQLIGYVGSTGRSTGPHLHFWAKRGGQFIDPESLELDALRVLPKGERDLFEPVKARYDAALDALPLPAPLPPVEAPAAPTLDPDLGADGDEPLGDEAPAAALLGVPGQAPVPAPPAPVAPPGAAPAAGGNPVFLTDKDLLRQQPAVDDGESED